MQWPPKYKRIILDAGDELAAHSGSKGGLQIGVTEVERVVPDADLSAWYRAFGEERS